jgi:hypothetical protein
MCIHHHLWTFILIHGHFAATNVHVRSSHIHNVQEQAIASAAAEIGGSYDAKD